ncbi:MAG: magnesium transporter CorA family protein [Oscillospiraceae bacterium]|jgi:magnesium transporter|nr:magnesium transporter CorA family protein [Oscillospiraceae bacterium]
MLTYYKTIEGKLTELEAEEQGCWIQAVAPTPNETARLVDQLGLDAGFVASSLDEEEASRIEQEDDQIFVVVDVPYRNEREDGTVFYTTLPLGVIITPKYFVTISSAASSVVSDITDGVIRGVRTQFKTQLLLNILLRIAQRFLIYLKQIDRISGSMESQLNTSTSNAALVQILGLEKSLVYFSSSLRANETTLKRISRGRLVTLYEDDEDLLEDTLIEINQAIEMTGTYSHILNSTMEAYANIINNNVNLTMKILASVTVLMTIPTMVFGYYGMNVAGLQNPVWWFPCVISAVGALLTLAVLIKLKMFK